MKRVLWLVVAMVWLGACGSDTKKEGPQAADCPIGERWNPILAQCVTTQPTPDNNGQLPDNSSQQSNNNGQPGTNNNGTNGGTNGGNGETNGSTNGNTIPPPDVCGKGTIIGVACAPSGELLGAADVTVTGIDCETGEAFEMTTRTDSRGYFEFQDVPAGTHNLRVHTGSFDNERGVTVGADSTTDLTMSKVCLDQSVEIAVIQGSYDHVEGVLDVLNLDYTIVGGDSSGGFGGSQYTMAQSQAFLSDLNAMNAYDIIFINCGELWTNLGAAGGTTQIVANLRAYVQGGKSLYVADWSAPFAEAAFPEMVDYSGDDNTLSDSRVGYAPQTIGASVLSPTLQQAIGATTAQIVFPQDALQGVINNNWAIAVGAGPQSTIHLQGNAIMCGSGGLFGGCPQGATQPNAALLVTYKDASGGTVVFTSFHNEQQVSLNQDMEKILRFLIFQL